MQHSRMFILKFVLYTSHVQQFLVTENVGKYIVEHYLLVTQACTEQWKVITYDFALQTVRSHFHSSMSGVKGMVLQ